MTEQLFHTAAASFEAALRVPVLPEEHRAARLHGHGYRARVRAEVPGSWAPFPGGEAVGLRRLLKEQVSVLDYRDLNEILPVPTDDDSGGNVQPVGSSCRVCPRGNCRARREPSILSEGF